ncbi:MFS transporter [Nocardiopsis sp. HUAS JQ3]|uniref:MFS transporter n=1 Tax=Nocardiopsis sp. HUAS JQ3 TaxID=3061629 RepID=UPI0023A9C56F|nr:MFS transporter [Nocardiopsis sp. HUAS JQ3]WDZ90081.1 MFS transporter [Nocardiopsis sp. HUAS JQ3]
MSSTEPAAPRTAPETAQPPGVPASTDSRAPTGPAVAPGTPGTAVPRDAPDPAAAPDTPTAPSPSAVPPTPRGRGTLALALLATAHFALSVDFNIVYIALPEIGAALGFTPSSLQWVVNAFALGYGGFLLLGGRAVDRLGARRVLVAGAVLMGAASVVGALAWNPAALVAARAAQGLGAAALFPATLALVGSVFPTGPERVRAMAVWGTAGAFGALAGGAVGGVLTSAFGWPSVFWALVPLLLAVALLAPRALPADGRRPSLTGFDAPGAVAVTAGSLLLVLGISRGQSVGWASWQSTGAVLLGLLALVALLLVERRSADPLLPPRLLANRSLLVTMALIFVLMGAVNTLHYVYTTHVQTTLDLSPLAAGLGFLPQGVAAMLGSALLLPPLLNRWGVRRALFAGTAGVGLTAVLFAAAVAADSYWAMLPAVVLLGVTAGTAYPIVFAAAGAAVDDAEQGVGSSAVSTSQQIGGAVGLAALVAVADAASGAGGAGLGAAALVGGLVTAAAALLALALPRR